MRSDDGPTHFRTYGSDDGSGELALGSGIVLFATVLLITHELPALSVVGRLFSAWSPLLGGALWLLVMTRGLKLLRERVSIPRGGHAVVLRHSSGRLMFVLLGALGIAILTPLLLATTDATTLRRAEPLVAALVLAAVLFRGVIGFGIRRLVIPAVMALLAGAWAYQSGLQFVGGLWVLGSAGVGLALSGAFGLRKFLKSHPLA